MLKYHQQLSEVPTDETTQLINKVSDTWLMRFKALKDFLNAHEGVYPTQNDTELYAWFVQQRDRKKKGLLNDNHIKLLNSINFIWDMQDSKWNAMYDKLVKYAQTHSFAPKKAIDSELHGWFIIQQGLIKRKKLRADRVDKMNDIVFEGNSNGHKWRLIYEKLVQFRLNTPDKWPIYHRKNQYSDESKLALFCITIRLKYNNKTLENYWIDKMQAINFDFEPHDTNWLNTYNKVKALIHQKESMSVNDIGSTAYTWIFNNTKRLNQGKLDNKHAELMVALNSLYASQTWEQTAHEVKIEWEQKERLPTLSSNKKLSNWLKVQKVRYRKGSLTAAQIKTLESIGFDFEDGKKKNEQKWLNQFEAYKKFKEENGTEPSAIDDYKLHIWVQTQRAIKAGTLRNRLIMAKEREDLLNSIHFNWVSIGSNKTWQDYFEDFLGYVKEGKIKIPVRIEGALNPSYSWFYNQKAEFKKGNLDVNKIEQFKKAGIDLSTLGKNNVWNDYFDALLTYMDKGILKLPYKIDGQINPLYNWFGKQKQAFGRGEMVQEKVDKFRHAGIDLSLISRNEGNK